MLKNTQQLLNLMEQLRHPEQGCPWDLKQDFATLMPYVIEEAYEVVDAIERNDLDDLRSELGDLLLQVVFQAQIAKERDLFDFEAIAASISDKLVRRHPHVFADVVFTSDEQRHQAWEQAKALERREKQPETTSALDGIAASLPALMTSEKIQGRAAQQGFDWPDVLPVFDKVQEELQEVKEAWQSGDQAHIQEEIGDLLFVAVNLARHLKVSPEIALKQSSQKFTRRFQYIEQQVAASGRGMTDCELAELDALWDEAKLVLKKTPG
ncbi:MAG: nucleoside triphosphate pyrophosphohydrolase [Methylovulum sp.]|uniref:nucleoside triphosphate pyrophosphohydrolase n=1 Tax=Methylovulum sp. TaxID=1916980 RepID=UPI002624C8AB|nr:nucleoside triphosphate pyrophosphohydrolase [Methylovulum sp.]MDD2725477.1 nucleoside triphosphate pyrophosphohydrolase [Methylovulum sp.]MDD5125665.1 nucleoside triphosphate pyrophosphohydrolase [Methylovulum sp.]